MRHRMNERRKGGGELLYTLQEVARKIKVSERTLYRWIDNGKLKARKVGRHWRVTEKDLQELLKGEEN